MATISLSSDLDVIAKYESLVRTSLSGESVYARLKDTVESLVKDGDLSDTEKAKVVADVLGGVTTSLTSAAMSTALQWASNEVELGFKKLELQKQLDILDNQKNLTKAQADKAANDNIATQAEVWRMYGKPTAVDGVLTNLTNDCKLYWDIQSAEETSTNLSKEGSLLDSRLNESYAAIHKTVADTVVHLGPWTYNLSSTGIVGTPARGDVNGGADFEVLTDVQRVIAKEQAKGYAYNAWSNAVTASAGMIGTVVASDAAITDIAALVELATSTITKLRDVNEAYKV